MGKSSTGSATIPSHHTTGAASRQRFACDVKRELPPNRCQRSQCYGLTRGGAQTSLRLRKPPISYVERCPMPKPWSSGLRLAGRNVRTRRSSRYFTSSANRADGSAAAGKSVMVAAAESLTAVLPSSTRSKWPPNTAPESDGRRKPVMGCGCPESGPMPRGCNYVIYSGGPLQNVYRLVGQPFR
jgi:hypothetical protein